MKWHYVDSDTHRRIGPIEADQFEALLASGKINPETPVWREGMTHWHPLAEATGRRRCRRRHRRPLPHRTLLERLLTPGTIRRHRRHPDFQGPPSERQQDSLLKKALMLVVYATFLIALGAGMWHAAAHPGPFNRSPLMHKLVQFLKGGA